MTKQVRRYLKKLIKIAIWVFVGFILFFIVVAMLIQHPVIQTSILHRITSAVSDKTKTTVEIENIRISFPKSVVVRGVYLDDLQQDTLLYAGSIKVNLALKDLLFSKINVNSVTLEDVSLNMTRSRTDTLFNYYFLIAAFTDTAHVPRAEPEEPSPWSFSIDRLRMENIRFSLDDGYGGLDVAVALQQLRLKMDELDLEGAVYSIDALSIEGLQTNVTTNKAGRPAGKVVQTAAVTSQSTAQADPSSGQLTEQTPPPSHPPSHPSYRQPGKLSDTEPKKPLPKISAGSIEINHSSVHFNDLVSRMSLVANLGRFGLDEGLVDLNDESITLEKLILAESEIRYLTDTTTRSTDSTKEESNWKFAVSRIQLDKNALTYRVEGSQDSDTNFNPSNMEIDLKTLAGSDLHYSPERSGARIGRFSATDQSGFAITRFETVFSFDNSAVQAKNLHLETTRSAIAANLQVKYASLQTLQDSILSAIFALDLQQMDISNSDILYFSPQLVQQPFFSNPENTTSLSGNLSGKMNDLTGTAMLIKAGAYTRLQTAAFRITGLPELDSARFTIPDLHLATGKVDIELLAGSLIPDGIELPGQLSVQIAFEGMLNTFESEVALNSSFGDAQFSASLGADEAFSSSIAVDDFNLGRLLGDTVMFGPLTLTAEATGSGMNINRLTRDRASGPDQNTLTVDMNAEIPHVYLNSYAYQGLQLDGTYSDQAFNGKIEMEDEYLVFDFEGLVSLKPGEEQYRFHLNLEGADLQELHVVGDDIQIGLVAVADIEGVPDSLNGRVVISNIMAVREEKFFELDSLTADFTNAPGMSEMSVSSKLIDLEYMGTVSPAGYGCGADRFFEWFFLPIRG